MERTTAKKTKPAQCRTPAESNSTNSHPSTSAPANQGRTVPVHLCAAGKVSTACFPPTMVSSGPGRGNSGAPNHRMHHSLWDPQAELLSSTFQSPLNWHLGTWVTVLTRLAHYERRWNYSPVCLQSHINMPLKIIFQNPSGKAPDHRFRALTL